MTPLLSLSDAHFVSPTTFRRSGERVSTLVWIGRDGESLVVLTPAGSGKVSRLRRDPRVQLAPCGRFGKVEDGARPVAGTADVREALTDVDRARATIRRTYPIESRLVLGIERLIGRLRGRPPHGTARPPDHLNEALTCSYACASGPPG